MTLKRIFAAMTLITVAFLSAHGRIDAVGSYTVTNLGTLQGNFSSAQFINDVGLVVGQGAEGFHRAFAWTKQGGMVDLLGSLGISSTPIALSESGVVVGSAFFDGVDGERAFAWTQAAGIVNLGTFGSRSAAYGVNDAGIVVGFTEDVNGRFHGFKYTQASGMISLPSLSGATGEVALAVNGSGTIVGIAFDEAFGERAVLWPASGGIIELGTLGGAVSTPIAINSQGDVAGSSQIAGNENFHAFLWKQSTGMMDLGTLGESSLARDLNEDGVVVGFSYLPGNVSYHAFVWTPTAGMVDILPGNNDSRAEAINDVGAIVGHSIGYAFVWTQSEGFVNLGPNSGFAYDINNGGSIVGDQFYPELNGTHATLWTPQPAYTFTGFFPPVDNPPTLNSTNAGAAVPVRFSLNGNQGLDIFSSGFPASRVIPCSSGTTDEPLDITVPAGSSSLNYDRKTDQYTYVWKTQKAWADTCRELNVQLKDGSSHLAIFKFTK